jgi:hypothetical protein
VDHHSSRECRGANPCQRLIGQTVKRIDVKEWMLF